MAKTIKSNKRTYKVDAFNPNTNTVYEFYGDYWHGNPAAYDSNKINTVRKAKFETLYRKTLDREASLIADGYNVVSVWEHDFKKILVSMNVNLNTIYRSKS